MALRKNNNAAKFTVPLKKVVQEGWNCPFFAVEYINADDVYRLQDASQETAGPANGADFVFTSGGKVLPLPTPPLTCSSLAYHAQ